VNNYIGGSMITLILLGNYQTCRIKESNLLITYLMDMENNNSESEWDFGIFHHSKLNLLSPGIILEKITIPRTYQYDIKFITAETGKQFSLITNYLDKSEHHN